MGNVPLRLGKTNYKEKGAGSVLPSRISCKNCSNLDTGEAD